LLAYSPIPSMPTRSLWGGASLPPHGGEQFPVNSNQSSVSSDRSSVGLDWTIGHDDSFKSQMSNVESQPTNTIENLSTTENPPSNLQPSTFNPMLLRLVGQIGATYLVAEGP